jgi:hypothetical protein
MAVIDAPGVAPYRSFGVYLWVGGLLDNDFQLEFLDR